MKARIIGVLLALALASPAAPADAPFDDAEIASAADPAWFKQSFLDLREDLTEARAAGRLGLMILFGTRGCAYCKAFIEHSLADPAIVTSLRRRFDVIHLEMFDDSRMKDPGGRELSVKEFARREGAQFSPTVVFYGLDGKVLKKVVGYQSPERFRRILAALPGGEATPPAPEPVAAPRAAAAPAARDPLFDAPPHRLDRRRPAARPLFVLFDSANCAVCRDFRAEVLADPEVRARLARFQAVALDVGDGTSQVITPDGRALAPRQWYQELGFEHLPAMVFYDAAGREALRIDSLSYRQRMLNSLGYVLDQAHLRDMSYQRYARERSLARARGGK